MEQSDKINETFKQLQKVIDSGESIKIKYDGSSQPGEIREIKPVKIDYEHGYLDAICAAIDKEKTFGIKKITIVPEDAKITYQKDFKGHEVKCKKCGKIFFGEKWREYCGDCYQIKMAEASVKICLEILDNENVEKSFISALKKKPIFTDISIKEKKKFIDEAFLKALDENDYCAEAISKIFIDTTLEKLISNVSDRLPGIPIIRIDEQGDEILVNIKNSNGIKDTAIGCLVIIAIIVAVVFLFRQCTI